MSAPVAPAEQPTAAVPALSPPARAGASSTPQRSVPAGSLGGPASWWPTLLTAGVLCFIAFFGGGGLLLSRMTTLEMILTIASGVIVAGVVLFGPSRARHDGFWAAGLLIAFSALTAVSLVWSVQPDLSWQDAGRMFAYSGVFAAAIALARAFPTRWPAVLGGVILAAAVVCGYALATKVFPNRLDASDIYARLRAPYSYWNAIGLTAAMGAIGCMWLGARRAGHALLSALAYPAMGLMLVTLLLAYSRGALAALVGGLILWFCIVPLRLRGAAVLLSGAAGAAVVVAWAFHEHALSSDNVALAARTSAGHQLGVLLIAVELALTLAGLAIGFASAQRAPLIATRRRAGAILLALLAFAIVAFAGALTFSHRGLTGTISHDFRSLTDPHAAVPPNTPGRLTAIASVRARYWNEALQVFQHNPVLGSGAEGYATARLRYRTETLDVRHAHGFVVQTLADLGAVGLALALALLACWAVAAGRSTRPLNGRLGRGERAGRTPYTPERIGLLTMLCLVAVFGIHSLVDWTWYVPGDACVALLCAGWLAGRGPLARGRARRAALSPPQKERTGLVAMRRDPRALALAAVALLAALLAAWAQWQPQRSVDASQRALALLAHDPGAAAEAAHAAVSRDPLSAQALFTLSAVQQANGHPALARATLQHAVRLQPSNPQTWLALGQYDLASARATPSVPARARAALNELSAAIYLNPESVAPEAIEDGNPEAITIQNDYVEALHAVEGASGVASTAP